ncbi:hypothetical protein CFC21_023362 [Triticum aestivum]|uniref:F-box domain-containing protein n=2 Tax=Triticum aestivum TaxID=4565 RepID=A0A9R1EE00_WHEAT|nr:hypothetical protein CFC21_023362 [Triticum aestivum]
MDTPMPKRPRLVLAPAPRTIANMAPEILLRLPSHDPARLVRASLVCWRWRRLLTDPAYLRRYRAFHRTPPMLGFILNLKQHYQGMAQLVPTSSFCTVASNRPGLNVLDARHGRVLLHTAQGQRLVVWDPVIGEECKISRMPADALGFNAAVLCVAVGCDHLDSHGGPFRVTFMGCGKRNITFACTYSLEAGA